jgi:signal transduction histidine kinase
MQRRASEDLLRSLVLLAEPDGLRTSIALRVRELTGCDAVVMCCLRSDADVYTAVCTSPSDRPLPEISWGSHGELARWLTTNQEPLLIPDSRGALEYLNAAERAVLRELSVRACVPIFSGARLTAILLICLPAGDTRVNDVDLDLLIRLGRQAGLALENAELHQLERERLKTLHQAQQLAVAGQMAATVAHEIRNPLTAIRSTVQYVVQSSAPWEAKCDLLNEILEEVDRIERTVGGILGLSRSVESEFADIELIDTVEQSLLLIGAYAQAHGVTVERQFEADSLPIRGDARELHQLCMNLFLNACQAMTDGGRLVLRCAMWQPSSGTPPVASLQVRDTGCGIPSDQLKRVFDPFFTTKRAGTGLGLPICLDIVARHGGNIRVESAEGIGTTATVLLPIRSI